MGPPIAEREPIALFIVTFVAFGLPILLLLWMGGRAVWHAGKALWKKLRSRRS